ncbi:MAG: hypothetical protein H8D84_00030 [Proteobacteria bacterium]|nr:hypothetical protein [Pseudomonadota bacterium]
MASTIQLKTGTGSAEPSSLTQGELAINITNGLVYYGSGSGNTVKQLESFTNITASGTISSSLNDANHVLGGQLSLMGTSNGSIHLYAGGTLQTSLNSKGSVDSWINAGGNNLGIGTAEPTATLHVAGNIWASGSSGHITASGNISASGYIYGRQFEQLESVCSGVILNTSLIYVPLGGQSLLEQAVTTNANVQKLAIAPGKPRKVIMRSMIGGGTPLGTTGFTCSYHSAVPLTGTISLIGEKYANSTGTAHEAVTFDFTETDINFSGSWSDVTPGSKVYMSLKADSTLSSITSLGVASLWEWDYNA